MVLKIQKTASEYQNPTARNEYLSGFAHDLLDYKVAGLIKGLIIPDNLIAELESYVQRNRLVDHNLADFHGCCPQCLKAHMLKTAENVGISKEGRVFLSLFMDGEAGHSGYYLDNERLVKL